jgi:transcriptional regulator with XRE-family HTH domain
VIGNETFGERIRRLREARKGSGPGFTLRGFARAVGVSPTFISKMERGHFNPPSAETVKRMALLLGVDPDGLLALAGKIDPDLAAIISQKPRAMARLLRTVHETGLTDQEILELSEQICQMRKP